MEKIRTFVAIRLPEDTRRRLAEIEKDLVASGADAKWVPEQNFHITLKFLGYVDAERLDAVKHAVESAVEGIKPFGVVLHGVGAFPKPSRPAVVWSGVSAGGKELTVLADRVESTLERLGFPREARGFSPHVTLGRVRSSRNIGRLAEAIQRLRDEYIGSFVVEDVVLMKSDLRPTGPIYTAIADFQLLAESG